MICIIIEAVGLREQMSDIAAQIGISPLGSPDYFHEQPCKKGYATRGSKRSRIAVLGIYPSHPERKKGISSRVEFHRKMTDSGLMY